MVERDLKGIKVGKKEKKMGKRGKKKWDVYIENVRVNDKRIIGGVEGRGLKKDMKVINRGSINI